jgi:hypothetical protein
MAGSLLEAKDFRYQLTFILEQTTKRPQETPLLLTSLPSEIHLLIISHLNPCFSVYIGLTCRKLYSAHRSLHEIISAMELDHLGPNKFKWLRLCDYLDEWVGPNWTWSWEKGKLIKTEGVSHVMKGIRVRRQLLSA